MPSAKPQQLDLFASIDGRTAVDRTGPSPAVSPAPAPAATPALGPAGGSAADERPPAYILRRSPRKTIGLTIRNAQLLVHAPTWVTRRQIETLIDQKRSWIQKKLAIQQERLALLALQDTQWRAGGRIPYLGSMIRLKLDSTRETYFEGRADQPEAGQRLSLSLPDSADDTRIQDMAQIWLQERATDLFGHRLQHYLDLAGQTIRSWSLSSAQGRWGSCSSQRRIRLNWRLIHLPPTLIDYVIAHEVAHLQEMNHSPAFWRVVARLYPDYKQARDTLAQHHPSSLPLF